ncbi:hypothetical protein V6N11_084019 [Hibiscus sabdariffa]|uniref:Uncharacterized protein n=1 Tax=Hibiscus sabdariffa TaxID=183260 RepID=A0ABR2QD50_9ROSI
MWPFLRAYKSQVPESFLNSLKNRYGETGIYKTSLLWHPCIIVCTPELCRKVLKDDEHFQFGYPYPSLIFGGKSSDFFLSGGHKRFRSLATSQINGHEALSTHIGRIEEIVISTLEELSRTNQPVQFLQEMNRVAFKARKMLIKIIQGLLAERRKKESNDPNARKGIIDFIKEVEDEDGEKLDDEHVILVLLIFLLAGRETSGRAGCWATVYLYNHPEVLQKAKVIDETLRSRTNTFALLREAKKDTNLNGHFIPKGWKVLVWHSAVHMDPEVYPHPKQFLPSR